MAATTSLERWALPKMQSVLPLPDEDILAAVKYAASMGSADEISNHFREFLGEDPDALEFTREFGLRLFPSKPAPAPVPAPAGRGRGSRGGGMGGGRGGKAPAPTPSQTPAGSYRKGNRDAVEDFYGGSRRGTPSLEQQQQQQQQQQRHQASSASGTLTSDLPDMFKNVNVKTKKTKPGKVHVSGGIAMRGAGAEMSDIDLAIRELERTTNPNLNARSGKREKCGCKGTKHELFKAAPNCLKCGYIVCIVEGIGPCPCCDAALLTPHEIQETVAVLLDARNQPPTNPAVATPTPAFTGPTPSGLEAATAHRDKLLAFQANTAQRAHIIDEQSDFNVASPWDSPVQRALQMQNQQKALKKLKEMAADPWERRQVVVSIDLKGRKVVKQIVEKPLSTDVEESETPVMGGGAGPSSSSDDKPAAEGSTGLYRSNPLYTGPRPVWVPTTTTQDADETLPTITPM